MKKDKWVFQASNMPYDTDETKNGLRVKNKLYSGKSIYQKIEIFDTNAFGRILVLDGIFQTSEKDEFIYHEMICHLPMFYHQNPKKILIVGGGDGGSLKEILKYPIEMVWMVEVDRKVIEVSKKYLPTISKGAFNSKKVEIIIGDGLDFIKKYKNFFDVIILDLSDPWGPAKKLISPNFYKNVKLALKRDGVLSLQGGSITTQPKLVATIYKRLKAIFSSVEVYQAHIPLYLDGEFSFITASELNFKKINLADLEKRFNKLSLKTKYYSPSIHQSSRVLPKFLRDRFSF